MALLTYLGIAVLFNLIMFIPAYIFRTDKLTDISYALTFIMIAGLAAFTENMHWVLLAMITAWGIRLGGFLLIRIHAMGSDKRFDEIRNNPLKFVGFWLLQGVSAWVILIPALFYFSTRASMSPLTYLGIIIWLAGMLIEGIADWQKYRFKQSNSKKWIDTGLWRYSRHPNYFGEILCWLGIYIYTVPALTQSKILIALISPIYITVLLRYISGIPMLEKRYEKKYGSKKSYREYKESTNLLILGPKS